MKKADVLGQAEGSNPQHIIDELEQLKEAAGGNVKKCGPGRMLNNMASKMRRTERKHKLKQTSFHAHKVFLVKKMVAKICEKGREGSPLVCPECGDKMTIFEPGPAPGKASPKNASPDRFDQRKGYLWWNVVLRDWKCNNKHVPKLECIRECPPSCGCGKSFPAKDFVRAGILAHRARLGR